MPVDPLAHFDAAEAYDRGRPGYAPSAVERLVEELSIDHATRVLDLAAGTGQLTRLLVPRSGEVVAIEPSEPLRRLLARALPQATVLEGTAERLPLDDAAVDAITVAEAFHWFARAEVLDELARVLVPGGGLALLWNVPVTVEPRWPDALVELLDPYERAGAPPAQRYASGSWREAFAASDRFGPLRSSSAEHRHVVDRDGLVAQLRSWSWVAAIEEPERSDVLARARELAPEEIVTTLRTDLHWSVRA